MVDRNRARIGHRGGSRNSLRGGGSGPEFFEGGGGLGSRSVGICIY